MLRLKVIACDVLSREISYLSSQSECYIDVAFVHQGLHDTPSRLNQLLQQEIDRANEGFPYNLYGNRPDYDYILLGYGLCSNGIAGISSSRIPLVIPKGHDCITLLLGSKERYQNYFDTQPGTYWFSSGWIDKSNQPGRDRYEGTAREYLEKYGEDNAGYLMELEEKWMKDYSLAAFIHWPSLGNNQYYRKYTLESAKYLGWAYREVEGDPCLLRDMLNGRFNENSVLVVPPGEKVAPSFDKEIIKIED